MKMFAYNNQRKNAVQNLAIIALSSGWVMIYADRLSISPVLNLIRQQFGLSFASVSLAAAGLLGYSYLLLVIFMGLHGAGAGAYYPTAYRISSNIATQRKGLTASLINSGMGFGTIIGLL